MTFALFGSNKSVDSHDSGNHAATAVAPGPTTAGGDAHEPIPHPTVTDAKLAQLAALLNSKGVGVTVGTRAKEAASVAPSETKVVDLKAEIAASGCPQCGSKESWGVSPWCPTCFYHPKMGSVVEHAPPTEQQAAPSTADTYLGMLQAVPNWARILYAGVIAIFVTTLTAAVALPADGPYRLIWTVVQAVVGVVAVGVAQVTVFLSTVPNSDRYGPFDVVLKPCEIWKSTIRDLPADAWRLWQVAWGLTATMSSLVLIGGIRYSAVFEVPQADMHVRKNVAPTVIAKTQSQVSDKQLDSYRAAMAKQSIPASSSEKPAKVQAEKMGPPQGIHLSVGARQAECAIVGYVKDTQGRIASILLGSIVDGQFTYVGRLSASQIPVAVRDALESRLPQLEQASPSLATSQTATWLKPVLTCRIDHGGLTRAKTLKDAKFGDLRTESP